jgi:stage II sporulation protein D
MVLYMKKSFFPGTTGIFCLFFIPYMITIIFNGVDTTLINRKFDVETILPVIVAGQIGDNYELETIKAQAVIARSNLYRTVKEQKSLNSVLNQIRDEIKNKSLKSLYLLLMQDKYERAVKETKGKVITWENKLKLVPFHEISAGDTRDGEEVFHSEEDAYLKSVHSSVDKESEDFLNSVYINKNILPKELEIKSRDSAGYVTELLADGKVLEGESFRMGMGLSSANFTIQTIGNKVRFLCKGKGHGLGFSQYGGNEMVKNSKTEEEILEYYFPEMEIVEIDAVMSK